MTVAQGKKNLSEKQKFAMKMAQYSSTNEIAMKMAQFTSTNNSITGKEAMSAAEERAYQAPHQLDLFALETRARRTIAELIKPIVNAADNDRREVA